VQGKSRRSIARTCERRLRERAILDVQDRRSARLPSRRFVAAECLALFYPYTLASRGQRRRCGRTFDRSGQIAWIDPRAGIADCRRRADRLQRFLRATETPGAATLYSASTSCLAVCLMPVRLVQANHREFFAWRRLPRIPIDRCPQANRRNRRRHRPRRCRRFVRGPRRVRPSCRRALVSRERRRRFPCDPRALRLLLRRGLRRRYRWLRRSDPTRRARRFWRSRLWRSR
jgi:hypothetical protein